MPLSFKSPALVTQDIITNAAKELAISFPRDYAEFLLKTNGGVPKPRALQVDAGDYKIERLYSLFAKPPKGAAFVSELVPMNLHFRAELELPLQFLALGLVDDQDVLLLTVADNAMGTVSVWAMIESGFDADRVTPVAASFGEFLLALEQPSEQAKERAALRKQFDKLETAIVEQKWAKVRDLVAKVDQSKWEVGYSHPVFCAIRDRDVESIRQMQAAGVNLEIADNEATTALMAAEENAKSESEVIDFLKSKGNTGPFDQWEVRIAEANAVVGFLREHLS